jgi:heptosyltransferase-2
MKRILVVLPNWYGETLFATPFLRLLRAQEPEAQLTMVGRPACREILLHHQAIHDMIDLPEHGIGPRARILGIVRSRRFDTAYILRRSLTRTALLAVAGIPERIGFDNRKSGWLLTRRVAPLTGRVHKAMSYLPLLSPAIAFDAAFDYTVSEEERNRARMLLKEMVPGEGPLAILHPGANWVHKRWPARRFAELGDRLAATHRARVLITGSPEEHALVAEIRQAMSFPAAVFAGSATVRQLAACLEQSNIVISNDTGILHIAAALRRPLIGLYGPTAPELTGPLGDASRMRVIHHETCCPSIPCMNPQPAPDHTGMASISVGEVFQAAQELLGGAG